MITETEKTRTKYDRISKFYDLMEGMMESGLTKHRKQLLSKVKGDILEIGVGTGRNLGFYNNKTNVTGIDLSPKMLSRAIKKAKLAFISSDLSPRGKERKCKSRFALLSKSVSLSTASMFTSSISFFSISSRDESCDRSRGINLSRIKLISMNIFDYYNLL